MESLFWCALWEVVCYLYSKKVKEEYNDIDINPELYIVGGALFGVFSLLWCWRKRRMYLKYRNNK